MKRAIHTLTTVLVLALFVFPTNAFAVSELFEGSGGTQDTANYSTVGNNFMKTTFASCSALPNWVITSVALSLRGGDLVSNDTDVRLRIASSTGMYTATSVSINESLSSTFASTTADFASPFYLRDQCTAYYVAGSAPAMFIVDAIAVDSGSGRSIRGLHGGAFMTGVDGNNSGGSLGENDEYDITIYGFDLDTGGDSTATRILTLNSPDYAETTPLNVVEFDYDYYFNSSTHFGILDRACVEITDATQQQQTAGICTDITGSGVQNFAQMDQLTEGHTYTWRAYLTASSTSEGRIYSETSYFNVVSVPVNQSVIPPVMATSTTALQAWFLGAGNAILGVPPWSYWVQMRTIMNTGAGLLTGTSTLPSSFVFQVGATTTPINISINVFSHENVTRLIPESFWTTAKALISFVIWVLFALMIYHEVHRRFSKPHG